MTVQVGEPYKRTVGDGDGDGEIPLMLSCGTISAVDFFEFLPKQFPIVIKVAAAANEALNGKK